MGESSAPQTRLFHAIILAGAALGGSVACGPAQHTCAPAADAGADADLDGGVAPCDPDAWPPTK